jgi:hypothetical protein
MLQGTSRTFFQIGINYALNISKSKKRKGGDEREKQKKMLDCRK